MTLVGNPPPDQPAVTINPMGNLDICSTGSVELQANADGGFLYQWKKGSANITGATNQIYTATAKGNYKVTVTGSNGCSKTSNVVGVTNSCRENLGTEASISATLNCYPNP